MSKFVSHHEGEIINGDGSVSEATVFVTSEGLEESIAKGSPIEKLLLEEVDGVVAPTETPTEVTPVVETEVEPEVTTEPVLALPAAGESSAPENQTTTVPVDAVVAPTEDSQS